MVQTFRFQIGHECDSWDATCDEIPGYLLVAGTLEQLRADIDFGMRSVFNIHEFEIVEIFEDAAAASGRS